MTPIIHFLKQPTVKENIKNVAGGIHFLFGFVEVYNIYEDMRTLRAEEEHPLKTAAKVGRAIGILSIFLTAGTSRPGVIVITKLVGYAFTNDQLERAFGPNTIREINPGHPRHICSLWAFRLGALHLAYKGVEWIYKKVYHLPKEKENYSETGMVLINLCISRVFLHVAAQYFSK